jgi:hypothetical protein
MTDRVLPRLYFPVLRRNYFRIAMKLRLGRVHLESDIIYDITITVEISSEEMFSGMVGLWIRY